MTQRHTPARQKSRLAIIAASAEQLERLCGHLIQTALKRNNAVLCAAPGLPIGVAGDGPFRGASLTNVIDRLKPGAEPELPHTSENLKSAVAEWRPDTILACGFDALPLAWQAARQIRLDRIACLLFDRPEITASGAFQRLWTTRKIRSALKHCFTVIIADTAQGDACRAIGVPLPQTGTTVIPGPGIDLADIASKELPDFDEGFRVSVDTGQPPAQQRETVRAIEAELGTSIGQITFAAPTTFSSAEPSAEIDTTATLNPPRTAQIVEDLCNAHIHVQLAAPQVLPSALMCALSVGRPILALDTPAHRTAIDERVNGVLLPSAEPRAIAAGIRDILEKPHLLTSMGRASHAKAERRFDAARLSGAVLDALMLQ